MRRWVCLLWLMGCTEENLAPSEPLVSLTPHDPTTTRDLQVFFLSTSTDPESDPIEYLFQWERDGVLVDGQSTDKLPATETTKGETWAVKVQATDGFNTSTTAIALTIINNSAPEVELTLDNDAPLSSEDVVATIDATDADGDEITTELSWARDGETTEYTDATLPAAATAKGQLWTLRALPNDGEEDGEVGTIEVLIDNGTPIIESVQLTPDVITEDSTVRAVVAASDPDGDELNFTFEWMVDGVVVSSGESDELTGVAFDRGQFVSVSVSPNDGWSDGDTMTSESIEVSNALPVVTDVAISPAIATVTDTLSCSYQFSDADNDKDQSTIRWAINGVDVEQPEPLQSSDQVTCTVTPDDGFEQGTPVSTTINIDNTLPVMDSVTLEPEDPSTDDVLTVSATASDSDGDDISFEIDWVVNGVSISASGSTLDGALYFEKDDEIYAIVTPSDASGSGVPMSSASVTVINSPPGSATVAIDPLSPVEAAEPLVCEIETDAVDPDDDAIDYTVTWTVDGLPFTDTETTIWTDDTVPEDAHFEGELWVCAAVPYDGEEVGTESTAEATIMGPDVVTDFSIEDVNKTSASYGQVVSPRDTLEQVSGWYFGHAT